MCLQVVSSAAPVAGSVACTATDRLTQYIAGLYFVGHESVGRARQW